MKIAKKALCIVIAAVMLFAVTSVFAAISGDVDGDGEVTAADARFALRAALDLENCPAGSEIHRICDPDMDGEITAADARLILRTAVGLCGSDPVAPLPQTPVQTFPTHPAIEEIFPTSTSTAEFAAILAKYKEVMDNTKATIKVYDKLEWTEITEFDFGSASGIVRPIVESLITDRAHAVVLRLDDHKQIPPVNDVGVGCALTDAAAIAAARNVKNGNGTATIAIVMRDEKNPEPMDKNTGISPSKVGGIFRIKSKEQVEQTIMENISKVPGGQLNSIDLTYKACSVVMTYDIASNHALRLSYTVSCHADASVKIVFNINAKVCLENHIEIGNMVY